MAQCSAKPSLLGLVRDILAGFSFDGVIRTEGGGYTPLRQLVRGARAAWMRDRKEKIVIVYGSLEEYDPGGRG